MKKVLTVVLALIMVLCITGCVYSQDTIVINESGSGKGSSTILIEKDQLSAMVTALDTTEDELLSGYSDLMTDVTIDGVDYKQFSYDYVFTSYEELAESLSETYSNVYANESGVRFVLPTQITAEDMKNFELIGIDTSTLVNGKISITMPEKIIKTTGTISEDGYTAIFEYDTNSYLKPIDVMVSTAEDTTKPTLSGFTSGKTYNKAITVKAYDQSAIKTAKYKKGTGNYTSFSLTEKFTKNGTYTVYATDYYGNKITKKFTIKDSSKPKVSGVTEGKTYTSARTVKFSDNCGVSKATLNGTKISSGKKVSAKGTYKLVVTDVNGLKKTVTFKIK